MRLDVSNNAVPMIVCALDPDCTNPIKKKGMEISMTGHRSRKGEATKPESTSQTNPTVRKITPLFPGQRDSRNDRGRWLESNKGRGMAMCYILDFLQNATAQTPPESGTKDHG
jgi:hypothetical protein